MASGCSDGDAEVDAGLSAASQWAEARALWHIDRDPGAYRAWMALDPGTPEGHEARRLLAEAEPLYLQGIEQVQVGQEATDSFERALRTAPMSPRLYLPLARAFRDQARVSPENPHLFIRAAEYYRKFIALLPHDPRVAEARDELAELDPEGSRLFAPPPVEDYAESPAPVVLSSAPTWPLGVAFAALVLATAAVGVLLVRARGPARWSLEELTARRPELHPAIAYLVGSLRHELIKHRIGAVGDAAAAALSGAAGAEQRAFLRERLFGGEPLDEAWEGHLAAFDRVLGPQLDLARADGAFRRAARALRQITKMRARLEQDDPRAFVALARALTTLRDFDAGLHALSTRLTRTEVDGALFREVLDEVRGEYAAGGVELDEVVIRGPEPAPHVEVFRVDLVLILKNVVRNAILAVGGDAPPRRIGFDVASVVEPTGEEVVRIFVRDTSPASFTTEDIYARRIDRGLGLVTAALARYDGSIAVETSREDGWAKAVVIRFFRAD